MNTEKLVLFLIPAEADPPFRSPQYQQELEEFASALSAKGILVSFYAELDEAVGSETIQLGKYTLELAKAAGPVLAVIAGAWLQARYGRKAA